MQKLEDVAKQVKTAVNDAIDNKLTKRLDGLDKRQDKFEQSLSKLEKSGPSTSGKTGSSTEYLRARKPLRISPCKCNKEAIANFLKRELQIPINTIRNIVVTRCKEVSERNLPPHRQATSAKKVEIEMETIDNPDIILSYAMNLTGQAGMDIVVPDFLRVNQVRLEHFAYKYRKASKGRAMGIKDNEAKTQVRLDNQSEGLVLGIREQKDSRWEFFSEDRLPKLDGTRMPEAGGEAGVGGGKEEKRDPNEKER